MNRKNPGFGLLLLLFIVLVAVGGAACMDSETPPGEDVIEKTGALPLCPSGQQLVYEVRVRACGTCTVQGIPGAQHALYARCSGSTAWKLIELSCSTCELQLATPLEDG